MAKRAQSPPGLCITKYLGRRFFAIGHQKPHHLKNKIGFRKPPISTSTAEHSTLDSKWVDDKKTVKQHSCLIKYHPFLTKYVTLMGL